ncbi:hypothetical protein [Helicobacter sp. 11S02596-1]|uniref:hypothetical protein n=1 Tax=Helicobacter sp. 11S02596-1 TaxID=1476194 RepID=UPI000BA7B443|nr:hypothetical protein [Helicobacter sp. 11S02596-1]PAF41377.1 hypothetical protein BJI48_08785 [Helicobacter sp. 11S02596-1]
MATMQQAIHSQIKTAYQKAKQQLEQVQSGYENAKQEFDQAKKQLKLIEKEYKQSIKSSNKGIKMINRQTIILQERGKEYGDNFRELMKVQKLFKDCIQIRFEKVPAQTRETAELTDICDEIKTLLALKLARFLFAKAIEKQSDCLVDFYNYAYLLTNAILEAGREYVEIDFNNRGYQYVELEKACEKNNIILAKVEGFIRNICKVWKKDTHAMLLAMYV